MLIKSNVMLTKGNSTIVWIPQIHFPDNIVIGKILRSTSMSANMENQLPQYP